MANNNNSTKASEVPDLLEKLLLKSSSAQESAEGSIVFRQTKLQKLTVDEAKCEAIELVFQYLCDNKIPLVSSLCLARQFAESKMDSLLSPLADAKNCDVLDGDKFCSLVMGAVPDFLRWWLALDQQNVYRKQIYQTVPYCWAVNAMKNRRRTMEDRHLIVPSLELLFPDKGLSECGLFCVFDGHGGVHCANYAATHLASHLIAWPQLESGDVMGALKHTFLETDVMLSKKCERDRLRSGCTAVCACVTKERLYVAWAGDSQVGLIQRTQVKALTPPHSPEDENEYARIEEAGGTVLCIQGELRVNGVLNLSRSLGDVCAKPMVIAEPSVCEQNLGFDDLMLLIACDGVWDSIDEDDCLDVLKTFVSKHSADEYQSLAHQFCVRAQDNGASDNLTAVVVFLQKPEDLWQIYS